MMLVENLQRYTGEDTSEHESARNLLGIMIEESSCFKGIVGGKDIFILMRNQLTPDQPGGAEIIHWLKGVKGFRQSSIFKHNSSGGHRILK